MKKIGCFLVFLCIFSTARAHAQTDLTLFGAAQHQGKLTLNTATTTAGSPRNFDPATFGAFGIRIGGGKVLTHEQTYAYAPNFLEADTKAVILNGNVVLQAPLPKIKPYGTAGIGTIISWGEDDSGRPSLGKIGTKFAINYGGGVKILPAGPVGIRFDIRGYAVPNAKFNIPIPTPTDPIATIKSESKTLNILEAGFGIIFSFGR